jgi:hypothetical protein
LVYGKGDKTENKANKKSEANGLGGEGMGHTKVALMAKSAGRAAGIKANVTAPSELRAEGKALRDAVPRESHGGWRGTEGPARPNRAVG